MSTSVWAAVRRAYASGVLDMGYPFARNVRYVGSNAPTGVTAYNTIADAIAALIAGDLLILGPQAFAEGNLSISVANVTIIGMGNRGACYIEPSGANDEGLQILADDVTLINVGVAKGASGDYALAVGSQTVSPDRFRAYGCKIEGDGVACKLWGCGDILFEDCEFAWCGTAIQLASNDIGFVTQTYIRKCRFHNFVDVGIGHVAAAQQVNNLNVEDCVFEEQEDGTAPTDFILLSDNANVGCFSGNRFATPTNDTAVLTIGSGILWMANATEAGWSTARPA